MVDLLRPCAQFDQRWGRGPAVASRPCEGWRRSSYLRSWPGGGSGRESGARGGRFDAQRAFYDMRAQVRIGPRSGRLGGEPPGGAADPWAAARSGSARGSGAASPSQRHRQHPGQAPGTIVVGAHHDTKDIPGFVGANDGASAVAVLLELARALPGRCAALGPTGLLRRGGGAGRQALRPGRGARQRASSFATRDAVASGARRR